MMGIILSVVLFAGVVDEKPLSYKEAYQAAHKSKTPMLILVGADWCPACRVMKQATLPRLLHDGKLSQVSYTLVDVDASPRISRGLLESNTIPQLVLCIPLSQGWRREYLHGSQSPEQIVEMIRTGLDEQQRDLAAAKNKHFNPVAENVADE